MYKNDERNKRPIISKKPLKLKRKQGEHSKKVQKLLKNNSIKVYGIKNGKPIIKIEPIKE